MLKIIGKLEFDPANVSKKHFAQSIWKKMAIARLGGDLHLYYAWLLKKRFGLVFDLPVRGAHITVVSDIVDCAAYAECRAAFHGKDIAFEYDPEKVSSNEKGHWWIEARSEEAAELRRNMGLSPDPYFGFHLTIGRANPKMLEHSRYISRQIKNFGI